MFIFLLYVFSSGGIRGIWWIRGKRDTILEEALKFCFIFLLDFSTGGIRQASSKGRFEMKFPNLEQV